MKYHNNIISALRGIFFVWKHEISFRVEFVFIFISYIILACIGITFIEWCIIVLTSILILVFEVANSIIENFADILKPQYQTVVRNIKDSAAGAVLLMGCIYLIIVCIMIINKYTA